MPNGAKESAFGRVMKDLRLDETCNRNKQFHNDLKFNPTLTLADFMVNETYHDTPRYENVRLMIDDSVLKKAIVDVKKPINSVIHYIYFKLSKSLNCNVCLYSMAKSIFALSLVLFLPKLTYASTKTQRFSLSNYIVNGIKIILNGNPGYRMWISYVARFLRLIDARNLEKKPLPRFNCTNV